ncbi:GEVED domain-containing protein, partial [Aequorivita viscosa]
QPGNLITSFDDVTPTSQTLVSNNFNLPWYEVVLDLPTSITLEGLTGGSKYWIGLTTTVGSGGGSNNFWEIKTNGTTAFTHTSIDQGATWTISPSGFDGVFQVIGQCSGEVIIPDDYCTVAVETSVAPITQVTFAGIANTTSAETSSPAQEYFLNIEGTVNQGDAYVISVEGNTDGDFASYFSAFIDWNQNGILDDSGEVYEIGSITNSTGSDGQTATSTIIIPFHAEIDQTRMRIIKSRDAYSLNPCSSINIGQAEDYTLNISEVIDTYCEVEVSITVEPITKVSFADIENVTSADLSAPGHEYFLTIEGNVEQASSYNLTVEGNTIGDNTHYFTAFIDWNQNGILDDAGEVYEIGEITNSTGTDGQQATTTIEIPLDALVGNTRIRIIKWHFDYPIDPCETIAFGQAEDYTLNVSEYINPYCEVVISETVTPITNVTFAGIDNPSTADTDAPAHELFVDIHGTVAYGNEYAISLEGFTDGNNTHYFTAFFDWNQNGVLDDAGEVYQLGTITNSTGTDGIKLVKRIEVAADALEGETRMRIIKSAEGFPLDPCGEYTSGQAEDYSFSIVEYCTPDIALKAPITRVVFAGIDNTSPSDPFTAPAYEPFLDIEGNVVTGETYDVTLQGNPIWDLCYTIFIDWNQNGVLDDAGEVYQIDCVYSIPAGDQGALAHGTVEVPEDAVVGATRMRVITTSDSLTDDGFPYDPCGFYYYAQAEDYTIIVRDNPLPTCSIECPEDISVQIPVGQSSSVVTYAVTYDCDNSDNISLELTEGISSGSEFPVGVTTVRYNVEMDGEVINSCEFTVTVEDVLSTGDLQEDTFKVYPNPVVDLLNISASKSINTVQIFDLSGKKVLDINSGKRTDIIDFSRLTTGVYLVKLISEDAVNVIKVIKM